MGNVMVDQIRLDGSMVQAYDETLSNGEKNSLLMAALPGAAVETYAGEQVVRFQDQLIMKKQVTYLGTPWESFKKRIQIPKRWVDVHRQALADGLVPRFIGIYSHADVTIFVDFDPVTYVRRKANNSAAHVATNDLYQAQILGVFHRVDSNGNALTSVRFDRLADYLLERSGGQHPYFGVFEAFNAEFLSGDRLDALDAVKEMHHAAWPDSMQGEWAGFYLEYRFDEFVRRSHSDDLVVFQKDKMRGALDYDLALKDEQQIVYYGDLKASNKEKHESPGNDAEDIRRCVATYGRFWYVIYEHETWHSRGEGGLPVVAWNEWRRSVGHAQRKPFDPHSYGSRFKSAVRFERMMILEVNRANYDLVLREFNQGRQPDGASRAQKVMISKRNIDNFLIYSAAAN